MNTRQTHHQLTFIVLPDLYSVCRLDADAPLPAWASSGSIFSITRTSDELSIVCEQNRVPDGVRGEHGWRCLRVAGTMAFSMIGVVTSFSTPLAAAGLGIFIISTFDTDYLFVKASDLSNAVTALRTTGHIVDLVSR